MRHLLATLFIVSEDVYLRTDNENVVMYRGEEVLQRRPLLGLENIISFSYKGASPGLMGECAKRGIGMCFLSHHGRFLARVSGGAQGNVLLRKEQYRISDNENTSTLYARNFIVGKLFNAHSLIKRLLRDHPFSMDKEKLEHSQSTLMQSTRLAKVCENLEELRGIEGNGAHCYFQVFEQLILHNKKTFSFTGRNKRPPLDPMNALLSFLYTLLANDCAGALESVGLDAYAGFLHRDRPGRCSLALDLMEELRPSVADRTALYLVNNRMLTDKHFEKKENGAVYLNDVGRKIVLAEWDQRKHDKLQHPFLGEKIEWGLIPYAQALLLARCIRGDLEEYPAFLWK